MHAENIYINSPELVFWGAVHFVILNVCVLVNSDGILDDFVIFVISNIFNHGTILKTVRVSVFLSVNDETQNQQQQENGQQDDQDEEESPFINRESVKPLVSHKIRKIFLILSFSFWSKIFFSE